MHILIFQPTLGSLHFAAFRNGAVGPILESTLDQAQFDRRTTRFPDSVFQQVDQALRRAELPPPDLIGVRALYGGEQFPRPVFVTDDVLKDLTQLAHQAPLHLPLLVEFLQALRAALADTPVAVVFETSFFVDLPERERWYALDPDLMQAQSLRRFGFHGIFHDAACLEAARRLGSRQLRIASVCLEPRPELAACVGRRPVMVTGGNTPIEGLPGETICGDLDPSVVLKLADDMHWGPEATSRVLSSQSGLLGMLGHPITLAELLDSADDARQLARDHFRHCVLRACGAAIAAMGGLDAIVYCGRYAAAGTSLHAWLGPRLARATRRDTPYLIQTRSLSQHLCDIVRVLASEASAPGGAPCGRPYARQPRNAP